MRAERLLFNEAGKILSKVIDSIPSMLNSNVDYSIEVFRQKMAKEVCTKVHGLTESTAEYHKLFSEILEDKKLHRDMAILKSIVLNAVFSLKAMQTVDT